MVMPYACVCVYDTLQVKTSNEIAEQFQVFQRRESKNELSKEAWPLPLERIGLFHAGASDVPVEKKKPQHTPADTFFFYPSSSSSSSSSSAASAAAAFGFVSEPQPSAAAAAPLQPSQQAGPASPKTSSFFSPSSSSSFSSSSSAVFASVSSSAYHPLSALSSSSFLSQFVSSYDEAEALREAVDRVEEEEEVIEEDL
jgi:hypothetical protein